MPEGRCDLLCLDLDKAESFRQGRPDRGATQRAAANGRALRDATRLSITVALRDGGELCVCDLAWVIERSIKLVSHHLGVLRAADMATSRRDGKIVFYTLTELGVELINTHLPRSTVRT